MTSLQSEVELLSRVLRPRLTRLQEVATIADRARGSAVTAWELLRAEGLIAPGMVAHPRCYFERLQNPSASVTPTPREIGACVALGADCAGAMRAETLACWAINELSTWLPKLRVERFVWRFVHPVVWNERRASCHPLMRETQAPKDLLHRIFGDKLPEDAFKSDLPSVWPMPRLDAGGRGWCGADLKWCRLWDRAVELGAELPRNPFLPLVDLWNTGYVLDEIRGGDVILACPYVGARFFHEGLVLA